MNKNRVAAIILSVATIPALAGCSTVSRDDALSIPGSVIQLSSGTFTEGATFGYVDREGDVKELTECGQPDLFSQRYCETTSGNYHFQWSSSKGNIYDGSIVIDGVKTELTCDPDACGLPSTLLTGSSGRRRPESSTPSFPKA